MERAEYSTWYIGASGIKWQGMCRELGKLVAQCMGCAPARAQGPQVLLWVVNSKSWLAAS